MEITIGILIGMVIGVAIHRITVSRKRSSGTFVMDFTDPMKDVFRIELDDDVNVLYSKKRITLRVKVHEVHSQK